MPQLPIPNTPGEITPEWLTEALRSTGTIDKANVTSVSAKTIAAGQGFTTQLAMLKLAYDRQSSETPDTLFCKVAATHAPTLDLARNLGLYEREVTFYRELADLVDLKTPRCYYSDLDDETGLFILLLEDLTPARVGDQIAGCSIENAERAVSHLARFHAQMWERPESHSSARLQAWNTNADALQERYAESLAPFLQKLGEMIPDGIPEVLERVAPQVAYIKNQLAASPQTVVHGDYRLDNLFFGSEDSGSSFAVVDWQGCRLGRGTSDISYFMSGSLDADLREGCEMSMLRSYHSTLAQNGVERYSFDQCLYDYRLALLDRISFYLILGATLDFSSRRAQALAYVVLQRFFTAVADHNVIELLP